jgi:hypothetical protein
MRYYVYNAERRFKKMKINFRKVVSVLATTAMLGSTVAFAAAAYPTPFVSSGAADAAIVVGSTAAASDMVAATDLRDSLNTGVTSTGSTDLSGTGDKVKIEKGATRLALSNTLSGVWGTSLTKTDLPTLLGDGVFYNKQNSEYKYEQKIALGSLNFSQFSDSDYKDKLPTLGFSIASNTMVANYTLDFITDPESAHGSDLTDFENKNIKLLGKEYYILDFKNSTAKLTLLDSATSATISEGETKTLTVGGKTYDVALAFITTDEVVLTVNGVNTEKMSATGTSYGNTYKMADGSYVGVKEINVQAYAGGTKSVTFSIGKGKLEITDASNVKMNDKSIDDMYGYIALSNANSKRTWQTLTLTWTTSDKAFLTSGKELVMPGFEAIKFVMDDTTMPKKEMTEVDASGSYVTLKTTIKDGLVTIPLIYLTDTTGALTAAGQSATQRLATSNTTTLVYNANSTSTFENDGFVVSYAGSRDAESYYLDVQSVRQDTSIGSNVTTIKNKVTGDTWTDRKAGDTITLGNVVLTIVNATYQSSGAKAVTFSVNSGSSFNTLYTVSGLKVWLPYVDTTAVQTATGSLGNITSGNGNNQYVWTLWMRETDKDGTIANGNLFNFTITNASSGSTYYTTVSDVFGDGTAYETPTSSSKMWESYVVSDLATKITHDKTATSPAQYSADVEYHGGQVYGNVYVAAPSVSSIVSGAIQVVKDTETASVSGKNLIVVGGSCINTVAATMLGSTTPLCGADFSAKTNVGAGQYLIQVAASPLNAGKIAMLVAGYEAADTTAAVAKVKEGKVDTSKMAATVYPIASA